METHKVLFVDDDTGLLRTIERNLCLDFDLVLASSGQAAVAQIKNHGPFSVIVVDMRMPGTDGIETIRAMREISPFSIYMMLTGNQDTSTALRAINDGQVYCYLNKPCEIAEIKSAIQSAQERFKLEGVERELLHETFVGSIGVMTDVIELQSLGIANAANIMDTLCQLAQLMDLKIGWEDRLAAKVALVGLPILTHQERLNLRDLDPASPDHAEAFAKLCQASAKIVECLPRLTRVGMIFRHVPKVDGSLSVAHPEDVVSATLLKVALLWNFLTYKGLQAATATNEIKIILPKISESLVRFMADLDDFRDANTVTYVRVGELKEGMVTFADIHTESGAVVVSRAKRLTPPIIQRLTEFYSDPDVNVQIVASSCPQAISQN
jgi:CheY-like chemotaxis protein